MKRLGTLWLVGLMVLTLARGDSNSFPSILTIEGATYSNVTLLRHTPATFTIRHATGIATLPIADLDTNLRAQFGYDPDKADQFSRAESEAEKRSEANARATREHLAEQRAAETERQDWVIVGNNLMKKGDFKTETIEGTILEKHLDGTLIDRWIYDIYIPRGEGGYGSVGGSFNRQPMATSLEACSNPALRRHS